MKVNVGCLQTDTTKTAEPFSGFLGPKTDKKTQNAYVVFEGWESYVSVSLLRSRNVIVLKAIS